MHSISLFTAFASKAKRFAFAGFLHLLLYYFSRISRNSIPDIPCLIQYTFLEIHIWSRLLLYTKISSNIPSHSGDAGDYNGLMKISHFKKLLNVFKATHAYSNCIVY